MENKKKIRYVNWLHPDDIRWAYDDLVWRDFVATIGGWDISCRRVSRILGKKIGQRYRKSWAYNPPTCVN